MTLWGIISIISAIFCFDMAIKRAKNGVGWAIGGLIFPILAPLLLFAMGPGPRAKHTLEHEAQRMKELEEALGASGSDSSSSGDPGGPKDS